MMRNSRRFRDNAY